MNSTLIGFILALILGGVVQAQNVLPQAAFDNAMIAVKSGNYIDGLAGFRKALTHAELTETTDDFLSKVHFNIGVCLYKLDRTAEAIPEYREAIRLSGNRYERGYYSLGMAELEANNFTKAEEAFLNALRINAKNGEAWFDLGFVYLGKKDYDSAKNAFQNSLKFNTVDIAIGHNNVGVLAAMKGDVNEAEDEFKLALAAAKGDMPIAKGNLEICKAMRLDASKATAGLVLTGR
jgi:tetratricopeptide (TPR) repeat protein